MISFALNKKTDSESGHETENGLFTNKKRLLMVSVGALAFVLIMILVLIVVFTGSVTEPTQLNGKPATVLVSGSVLSKAQSIKPALTLAYATHLLQTRWPVFVAVGAVLAVSILLAVIVPTLLHSESDNVIGNNQNSDSLEGEQEETESVSLLTMIAGVCGGIVVLGLIIGAIYYKVKPTVKPAVNPIVNPVATPIVNPAATPIVNPAATPIEPTAVTSSSDDWLFDLAKTDAADPKVRLFALCIIGVVLYNLNVIEGGAGKAKIAHYKNLQRLYDLNFPVNDNNIIDVNLSSQKVQGLANISINFSDEQKAAVNKIADDFRKLFEDNSSLLPKLRDYNKRCKHYDIAQVRKDNAENMLLIKIRSDPDLITKKKKTKS